MRHVAFGVFLALYIVIIGQSWAVYTSAILLALWVKQRGRFDSVPFTIGGPRPVVEGGAAIESVKESAPPETSGT